MPFALMVYRTKEEEASIAQSCYNTVMNKQMTLSLISDELVRASTRKKEFLAVMSLMIPWSEWAVMVKPLYYKGERGNKPFDPELMLRIHILHKLYGSADMATMNEMIDSPCLLAVWWNRCVQSGAGWRYHRAISSYNGKEPYGDTFPGADRRELLRCDLILPKETIDGFTLISAPSSMKKDEERDPEAHQAKKVD